MSANDYHICPACFSAYIAKIDKRNKNLMTEDRREITDEEILTLIDWYLNKMADSGERGISFDSDTRKGMRIHMRFKKADKQLKGGEE